MRRDIYRIFLLSWVLTGCAGQVAPVSVQAPTGNSTEVITRESYLIPPELPPTLIDFILAKKPRGAELCALRVRNFSAHSWTLDIEFEELPNEIVRVTKSFTRDGDSWREL